MKEMVSNYTSIGNTNNKALRVVSIVAATKIKERQNYMTDDKKISNKKDLSMFLNNNRIQSLGREF